MQRSTDQAAANADKGDAGENVRQRRVPAYFTLYLLGELLSSLRPRQPKS